MKFYLLICFDDAFKDCFDMLSVAEPLARVKEQDYVDYF